MTGWGRSPTTAHSITPSSLASAHPNAANAAAAVATAATTATAAAHPRPCPRLSTPTPLDAGASARCIGTDPDTCRLGGLPCAVAWRGV